MKKPLTVKLLKLGFAKGQGFIAKEIYKNYLSSDEWRLKKLHVMFHNGGRGCIYCGAKKNLDVHHLTYRNIGDESLEDLIVLCRDCHKEAHANLKFYRRINGWAIKKYGEDWELSHDFDIVEREFNDWLEELEEREGEV